MSTLEQIVIAKTAVSNVPHKLRAYYVNVLSMRNLLAEKEKLVLDAFEQHAEANPLHLGNSAAHPFRMADLDVSEKYSSFKAALDLLESRAEFAEAMEVVQPLVEEVERLEAQLAAENDHRESARIALAAAEEAALAAAKLAALDSPAVVKARQALAAIDAPAKAKAKPAEIGEVS